MITDEDLLPLGYGIWEYRHMEDKEPKEAQIEDFCAEDGETAFVLLSSIAEFIKKEGAVKIVFRLPARDRKNCKGCFERAGYTVSVEDSEWLRLKIKDFLSLPFVSKGKGEGIKALNRVNLRSFRQEIVRFVLDVKRDALSEVRYLPFTWYDIEISCLSESVSGADGFFLVHETPSGILRAEIMDTADRNAGLLAGMISFFAVSLRSARDRSMHLILSDYVSRAITELFGTQRFAGVYGPAIFHGGHELCNTLLIC